MFSCEPDSNRGRHILLVTKYPLHTDESLR